MPGTILSVVQVCSFKNLELVLLSLFCNNDIKTWAYIAKLAAHDRVGIQIQAV